METKILTTVDEDLKIAADILKRGGNVIFPTETVYGLGADATNADAIGNIFKAKGRPSDNPLIVHVSDISQLDEIAEETPDAARVLMDKFWPGPLTIILKKCKNVPYETTGGLDTVAVRMPGSAVARRIIELAELPIAAPSANLSGKPSPTEAKHCIDDMNGRVDAIVCGEPCEVGVESTVIDMTGEVPVLLRPGGVTAEQIEEAVGRIEIATSLKSGEAPKSPGLKYKHYSPDAEVVILSGSTNDVCKYIEEKAKESKVGVLTFDEFPVIEGCMNFSLGSVNSPDTAAKNLFSSLREMDENGVQIVFAPEISDEGLWTAVRNRLYRAAGEKILKVPAYDKKKVLFVCTGNTCRSPMAEAIFNNIAEEKGILAEAESAGIFADGSFASANAVLVMRELGVDIEGRASRQLIPQMIENADLVLTMSKSHKSMIVSAFGALDKVMTMAEFSGGTDDVDDPFGRDANTYRNCREQIKEMVEKVIDKL